MVTSLYFRTKSYANLMLALIVISLLTGCAGAQMAPITPGQVYALQLGSTQWGLTQAAKGAIDTFIMSDGAGNYMFSWAINDAWAFVPCKWNNGLCTSAEVLKKANLVNAQTMSEFVTWLEEHGWKVVSAAELPVKLAAILQTAAGYMPTFLVVPGNAGWELQEYQDWKGDKWY